MTTSGQQNEEKAFYIILQGMLMRARVTPSSKLVQQTSRDGKHTLWLAAESTVNAHLTLSLQLPNILRCSHSQIISTQVDEQSIVQSRRV